MKYEDFLASKSMKVKECGFHAQDEINPMLFTFQKDIVKWALQKGKAAVFAGCGLGKSPIQLEWAKHVCNQTDGKVLIVAPLAVANQTQQEGVKFGIETTIIAEQSDIRPGINITNYEKLQKFDLSDFVGVVLDECFPPGTPIEVFNTERLLISKRIEDIREGDKILNAFGEDHVKSIYKRRINRAVRITANGHQITCSENHPFFTMHGWRCAQDLLPGDYLLETRTAMRLVRKDVSSEISSTENAEILREILLSELADESTRNQSEGTQSRGRCEKRNIKIEMAEERKPEGIEGTGAHNELESFNQSRNAQENFIEVASDEAQTFRAWGKWSSDDIATANNEGCTVRQLDSGICYITGKTTSRFSDLLQGRLRQSRLENSNRNRRRFSSFEERTGCKERSKAGFVGVESIEILESGHPELEKYRNADGNVYFYDLKAERHPSYSIEGILVHNSSILKSYDGKTRTMIINMFADTPYKLACTATPSPNDYAELGNHAEFLGIMKRTEVLASFFVHDSKPGQHHPDQKCGEEKWRLKGHAVKAFWQWVASWAVMTQKPSDLGYEDNGFVLPELRFHQVTVKSTSPYARTIQERQKVRGANVPQKVTALSELVLPI